MVKASADITLADITDIDHVTRYYLMQSATLATPAKPTGSPPGGGWGTTEPGYTAGDTKSLYLTDLTVWSNGEYDYSEVSLSASFEAARAAYNKAQAAADAASSANDAVTNLRKDVGSDIDQAAESLKSTVYEKVYLKDDVDKLVSDVSTTVTQTKNDWQIVFDRFQRDIDAVADGSDAAFKEIRKYIRFEDGSILLGNSASPLVLKIRSDRIQFLQNGYEVAYFADQKMYNTVVEVTDKLIIGNSAWKLEDNGSVSLIGI